MNYKRIWAIIFVCIIWCYYIIDSTFKYLVIMEYREISTITAIAIMMIITTIVINKITYYKYFLVCFLSLVSYSFWIINLDISLRGLPSLPNAFSELTPIIVVAVNYAYEKIKIREHISKLKSFGISTLQGLLAYLIVHFSIVLFFLIY